MTSLSKKIWYPRSVSKTLTDTTPNVFQIENGEKMKHHSNWVYIVALLLCPRVQFMWA